MNWIELKWKHVKRFVVEFGELFVSFEQNSRFPNIALISLPLITEKAVRFGKFSSFDDSVTGNMMWGI